MMKLHFWIKRAELTPRKHGQVIRRVNMNAAKRQQARLPKHFANIAYSEYKAKRRTSKYTREKQRKYGHTEPNVKTGVLLKSVLAKVKLTATQYGWKLTTRGTTTSRLQNWQLRELQVVSPKERRYEDKMMAREYRDLSRSPEYQRQRSRRTK